MTLLEKNDAVALARAILAASPARETEVTIECVEDRFARFADAGPTQSADRERCEVAVRVRVDASGARAGIAEARASAASLDLDDAREACERAIEIARQSTPSASSPEADASSLALGGPVEIPESAPEPSARAHDFAAKARWIASALDACARHELAPAGMAQTTVCTRTLCNSAGRIAHGGVSRASFSLTASVGLGGEGGSGFAEHIARSPSGVDADAVVRRAVDKALRARDAHPIEPAEHTVVLEPAAVSALLLFMAYQGFGARAVEEESSFLCGRIGARALSESISIVDDARHPLYPGIAFDGEGSPRRRALLVDRGRIMGPVTDRRYARARNTDNTGHALPQPSLEGPRPQNLVLLPGDASQGELVARVERGILVTQLHYVNLIDPRELLLTGMTRNGTFRIENGRVTHAIKNLRFTESLVRALSRVRGVGRDLAVSGALFEGEMIAPALAIDGFRFTSGTDF
jgi:predicted Zn-dependent protease